MRICLFRPYSPPILNDTIQHPGAQLVFFPMLLLELQQVNKNAFPNRIIPAIHETYLNISRKIGIRSTPASLFFQI